MARPKNQGGRRRSTRLVSVQEDTYALLTAWARILDTTIVRLVDASIVVGLSDLFHGKSVEDEDNIDVPFVQDIIKSIEGMIKIIRSDKLKNIYTRRRQYIRKSRKGEAEDLEDTEDEGDEEDDVAE